MPTNKISFAILALTAAAAVLPAQVLAPTEMKDASLRELQQKDFPSLKKIGAAVTAHHFPYHFYCSRVLDVEEKEQPRVDQRSIRFGTYDHQTVLEITGNYYVSYSAELLDAEQRARHTLTDVMEPILEAAIPAMQGEPRLQAYALEVSHHVRKQVLGVTVEAAENVEYFLPSPAAAGFLAATTLPQRQAALMQGALFVNGTPAAGWEPQAAAWMPEPKNLAADKHPARAASAPGPGAAPPASAEVTPEIAGQRQASYQAALNALVRDLGQDAHFVDYAPPTVIAFHNGAYLQLSFSTTLKEADAGSQYRAAALAFDEHVAHLIRPVLAHLPYRIGLDGLDFSTTVRPAGAAAGSPAVAVEFVFPLASLASYDKYDSTGQQLINQGFVLINGERASLNLQDAEAGGR